MAARRGSTRGLSGILLAILHALWQGLVGALALLGLGAVAVVVTWAVLVQPDRSRPDPKAALERMTAPLGRAVPALAPEPSQERAVIYLNREGALLVAGRDDATRNMSSVVASAGLESFEVPAYHLSNQSWDNVVSCVEDIFAPYDVEVVDQRPVEGHYVMAMVGGRAGDLASSAAIQGGSVRRPSGLAPLGQEPIPDAVVFAFARDINGGTRVVCETVAHEVGHAFGLDHEMDSHDPMSYLPRSGRRTFQDEEAQCGERAARLCADGEATQNSHQHLLEVLGPREEG